MNISLCDNTLASPTPEKRHWDFPNLEIPEAPLHHGGVQLEFSCQKIPEAPPHHGGDLLGHTLREGPQ